jgi:hypothetical protein
MELPTWTQSALELTELVKDTPAWRAAQAVVREMNATGQSHEWAAERVAELLKEDGLDLDELLDGIAAQGITLPDDARAAFRQYFALHMLAAVVADLEGQEFPMLPMLTGGVQTVIHKEDEFELPVVIAIATPLTSGTITEDFQRVCDRTFAHYLGEHENALRDAEWFRRYQALGAKRGSYREIALSDPRSGILPEAMAEPENYPEEVRKAAHTVGRAVRRYRDKWTQVLDSVSTKPD